MAAAALETQRNTHLNPCPMNTRLASCLLATWLCALTLPTLPARGADNHLVDLYEQFLADGNTRAFVSFQRELLYPKKETSQQEIKLPTGQVLPIKTWDKDYLAIARNGALFILAFSTKQPVLDESQLLSADELSGFDGEFYWMLRLDSPVQLQLPADQADSPPLLAFNTLTLIPKAEAQRPQGKFRSDVKFASLQGLHQECLSVLQLGWTTQLERAPRTEGAVIEFPAPGSAPRKAEVIGSLRSPAEIRYGTLPEGAELSALLEHDQQSVRVRRSARGKLLYESRYQILAFEAATTLAARQDFSFRPYHERAGAVIGMVMTNGATVQLNLTNQGKLEMGGIMDEAQAIRAPSRLPLYALLGLAAAGAALLLTRTTCKKE
jgi:hypothetical protein